MAFPDLLFIHPSLAWLCHTATCIQMCVSTCVCVLTWAFIWKPPPSNLSYKSSHWTNCEIVFFYFRRSRAILVISQTRKWQMKSCPHKRGCYKWPLSLFPFCVISAIPVISQTVMWSAAKARAAALFMWRWLWGNGSQRHSGTQHVETNKQKKKQKLIRNSSADTKQQTHQGNMT